MTHSTSANIPFITGNVKDEGTIFVNPQAINTTADLRTFLERDYLNRNASFFRNVSSTIILELLYPNIPALGSPFGTGDAIFHGPQFKRAAATYGGKMVYRTLLVLSSGLFSYLYQTSTSNTLGATSSTSPSPGTSNLGRTTSTRSHLVAPNGKEVNRCLHDLFGLLTSFTVFHTSEIPYVFMKFTPADGSLYQLSKQMLAYWCVPAAV